ncbi:hypothetical protein JXQ31_18165 [candidate division KSB1 bacterium]|nr:hypothetical protein [candidate division KSB1 bacterium]
MKRILLYAIIMAFLWFMTIGMSCQEREIEVPVLGSTTHPFEIHSSNNTYNEQDVIDLSDAIDDIRQDNDFDRIVAILLQSVTFTVTNNQSQAGTVINGEAKVSSTSFADMKKIADLSSLALDTIENVEQTPPLLPEGVMEVNKAISPILGGTNLIYFSVGGTASPSPPPDLRFDIVVKVYINVIGIVKTEVPVI